MSSLRRHSRGGEKTLPLNTFVTPKPQADDPSTTSAPEHHPYSLFKSRSENRLLKDPSLQQHWIKARAYFREYGVLHHLLAGSRPGQQERTCNTVSMWMCQLGAERCAVFSVGTACIVSAAWTPGTGVKVWLLSISCNAGMYMHVHKRSAPASPYGHRRKLNMFHRLIHIDSFIAVC